MRSETAQVVHRRTRAARAITLDEAIIALILAKEFILDFLGLGLAVNFAVCLLIALRIMTAKWRVPFFVYAMTACLPLLMILAALGGGSLSQAAANISRLLQVCLYGLFFLFLKINDPNRLRELFERGLVFFNVVLILNMAAIVVQYSFPGMLIAVSDTSQVMDFDAFSGLFGAASTHSVALYTVFIIVLDIYMVRRNAAYDQVLIAYVIAIGLFSLYIATINDNKALFFLLPLSLLLCLLIYSVFNFKTAATRILPCVLLAGCIFFLLYLSIPVVRNSVEVNISKSIDMIASAWHPNAYVNGSDERFKMIPYALSLPGTWLFGDGLGAASLYQDGYRGFNHFGQSDFGSIAILGGIWLYLLILFFYARIFAPPAKERGRKKALLYVSLFVILACASIFTQVFSQVRISIPLFMLCYVFYLYWEDFSLPSVLDWARDADQAGTRRSAPLHTAQSQLGDGVQEGRAKGINAVAFSGRSLARTKPNGGWSDFRAKSYPRVGYSHSKSEIPGSHAAIECKSDHHMLEKDRNPRP